MYRSHKNHELRSSDVEKQVTLCGWVHRRRDHGGLIFIDLRDRYGLTQIAFDPSLHQEVHAMAEHLRSEFVIMVKGKVRLRPEGMENSNLETGTIELLVEHLTFLNHAKTPPF